MSLIPMAVGGGTLAQLTSLMASMGSEAPIIGPYIQQASRSLANVFGLPSAIVNKATGKTKAKEGDQPKDEEEGESDKNILQKMMEGFGKLLEKLREGINNSPSSTPPPGGGDLSPVSLEGLSEKEISDLGRMVYAEAGASEEGAAHVLNAILNRYRQVKQGKATPQAWGVRSGVTAEQMTITDLLYAENQFQPIRDKRFDKVSAEQGTQALNAAIKGGGLDPSEIKSNAVASGMTEQEASRLAVADTFYNPTVSSNKPFKDAPVVNTDNKHAFMSSPNTGFRPEDLSTLRPVVQTAPPPPASQQIQENFGMKPNDKFEFVLGGQRYQAYKTTQGFDFFEITLNPLDANPKVTDPEKLKVLSEALRKLKTKSPSAPPAPAALPPTETSSLSPPPGSREIAEAISTPLDSNGQGNIVAMMLPQGEQSQTATTTTPPTHETSSASGAINPLINTGHYSNSLFT
jgi:hypothetical protein